MTKKLLIIGLLAFVFATPFGARAQTAAPVTNEQLLEIIQSLMQQVLSLMEQLKKIEANQTASSQTLTAIQTQTAPVQSFGVVSQPVAPVALSIGQQVENKFGEKATECASTKVSWINIFNQLKPWFNAPERTESEKQDFYNSYSRIDKFVKADIDNQLRSESLIPITSYCSSNGCSVVLEIQKSYVACMLGQ